MNKLTKITETKRSLRNYVSRSMVFSVMLSFVFISVFANFLIPKGVEAWSFQVNQSDEALYEESPTDEQILNFYNIQQSNQSLPTPEPINNNAPTNSATPSGNTGPNTTTVTQPTTGKTIYNTTGGKTTVSGTGASKTTVSGTGNSQPGSRVGSAPSAKNTCGTKICNPLGNNTSLDGFLEKLLKAVNVLAAMVVVFFIIYAGFKYVTAMGDTKKIEEAHNTLKWTVIGAAILFGAQVIASVIKNTVTELVNVK